LKMTFVFASRLPLEELKLSNITNLVKNLAFS